MSRVKVMMVVLILGLLPVHVLAGQIQWQPYAEGLRMAKAQDKPVYLHFKAQWCSACTLFERTAFENETVIDFLNTHFVAVKVDGDENPELLKKYQVRGYPDSLFLDTYDNVVYRRPGAMAPEVFLFFLEYIQSGSYRTQSPMEYYRSR